VSAASPAAVRPSRPRSGHPSQTSVSCSIATNAAPASAIVPGKVGTPAGAGSNTARTSTVSTTAWPSNVRQIAATITSTVSAQPAQLARSVLPGQSSHQNATIATTGSPNVTSGASTSSDGSGPPAASASSSATGTTSSRPSAPSRGWRAQRSRCAARARRGCRASGALMLGLVTAGIRPGP